MSTVVPDTNDNGRWDWGEPEEYLELELMDPEDVKPDESEDNSTDITICKGITKEGNPCPQSEWKGTGFCYIIRHNASELVLASRTR